MEAPDLLIPAVILLTVLAAWLLSVIPFRFHPWAIAGWLPATGLAAFGTLAFFGVLLDLVRFSREGGAGAGFAAMGAASALPVFLLAPLFLGLSLYLKPPEPHSDAATFLALSVFSVFIIWFLFALQGGG